MRVKRKKILYLMFLLVSILMFLHGWATYINPEGSSDLYAKKNMMQKQSLFHHALYKTTQVFHV